MRNNRIEVNHFVFDEFKISEILFFQLLPRYPFFYSLLSKKQTPLFIHFFERSLKHTFLFSKFLDPVLIDSFFLVQPKDFKVDRPLEIPSDIKDAFLQNLAEKSQTRFSQMIDLLFRIYPYFPMNLVLRTEMLRSYIRFFLEHMNHLLQLLSKMKSSRKSSPENTSSFEDEEKIFEHIRVLRNVSLSLFMTIKLINWYNFLEKYDFIDLFVFFYEYLALKLSESKVFKKELVLKFLSLPVLVRRNEVKLIPDYPTCQHLNFQKNARKPQKNVHDGNVHYHNEALPFYFQRFL